MRMTSAWYLSAGIIHDVSSLSRQVPRENQKQGTQWQSVLRAEPGRTLAVMELRGVSPEIWMFFWPLLWKEPDTTSQIHLLTTGTCWEMVASAGEEPPNTANSALTYIKDLYEFGVDAIWIWQEGTLWVPGQWICAVQDVAMGEVPGWFFWNANGLPWKGEERRRSREASKVKEGLLRKRAKVWKESMETSVWNTISQEIFLKIYLPI